MTFQLKRISDPSCSCTEVMFDLLKNKYKKMSPLDSDGLRCIYEVMVMILTKVTLDMKRIWKSYFLCYFIGQGWVFTPFAYCHAKPSPSWSSALLAGLVSLNFTFSTPLSGLWCDTSWKLVCLYQMPHYARGCRISLW